MIMFSIYIYERNMLLYNAPLGRFQKTMRDLEQNGTHQLLIFADDVI
jgi:hypothetical protein